jgi:predicted permease
VPVALFAIGVFMAGVHFKQEKAKEALLISAFRLLPYALLAMLLAPILGISGLPLIVTILMSMMPVAVLSFVLAVEYKLDADAMAIAIVLTTILLPIPIWIASNL